MIGGAGSSSVSVGDVGAAAPRAAATGAAFGAVPLSSGWVRQRTKAAGLPLEVLRYSVEVETANGQTRAAPITLDRIAVGKLVEYSVPALVAPPGQMKTNLLGMSFLNRLESWEVRADRLMLRGYP